MPLISLRRALGLLGVVGALGTGLVGGASPAAADSTAIAPKRFVTNDTIAVADISPRGTGGQFNWQVKLDDGTGWGYDPCLNPGDAFFLSCPAGAFGYFRSDAWSAGSTAGITPNLVIPNATFTTAGLQNHQFANKAMGARVELYPYGPGATYDPWTQDVGGIAINAFGISAGGVGPNLGTIVLPVKGAAGVGRLGGAVVASTPIADGRVHVDAFQEHSQYDNFPYSTTSTGFPVGGFASLGSKGAAWTTGWNFEGQYHLFVTDTKGTPTTADDVKIQVLVVMRGDMVLPLDLDAPCFGLDECAYDTPAPYTPVLPLGGYHPVAPARIMDTRDGTGRFFHFPGPVGPGDGSSPGEPNPTPRLFNQINHEAQVTGVGGVPSSGVSAVVLNVTVDQPTNASFLSVYPKPPRINDQCGGAPLVYCDQASFGPGTVPNASNLNFVAGQTIPNLVVVRVGAGGKVRMRNNTGSTHVIFDVVGWFDTGAGPAGDRFTGITPVRLMDTRAGSTVGPYATPFGPGQERDLLVTGGAVPPDASAVVLNVTALNASAQSFLTVWPDGVGRATVSNLNFGPGRVVPNLVMVKVGANQRIRLYNNSGTADALVDIVGYYRSASGNRFQAVAQPSRILDTRFGIGTGTAGTAPVGPGDTRTLAVGGVGGVPPTATAVIMNVTVTSPTAGSHLTVFPADVTLPTVSNLNFGAGQTVPNLVMVKLSGAGAVKIFNNAGSVHVIADVAGYIA